MGSLEAFLVGRVSTNPLRPKPPRLITFQVALPDLPGNTPTGLNRHFQSTADLTFRVLHRVLIANRRCRNIKPASHRLRLNGLDLGAD